ncbi:MAG: NAD(P)-dependent alcohol dehydrogenase [Alphaproteobacteria bacterium]|nr:NAD(P)-dependent alcohol dehydrogenase [Alphaproteobacteria bacterium]
MKAMVIKDAWGPENLKPEERADPTPAPGELVIAMKAISINPRDLIMSQGGYGRMGGSLPLVPLCDGAGIVAALGEGVDGFAEGDLVVPPYSRTWMHGSTSVANQAGAHGGPLDGTAQEQFLVPAKAVVRAPAHMSAAQAATLPCAAVTAWNAIVGEGKVKAGDLILLQGTGGVSLFALQFTKMHGADVIITSSSDEKLEKAKSLGADHLINYKTEPDWHKSAREISGAEGVDHIIEVGGAGTVDKSISAVRPGGLISLIGVLSGAGADVNLGRVVTRHVRMQGVTLGSKLLLEDMCRAMEHHETMPVIDDRRFEFEGLGSALQSLPEGRHFGKIVCEMG